MKKILIAIMITVCGIGYAQYAEPDIMTIYFGNGTKQIILITDVDSIAFDNSQELLQREEALKKLILGAWEVPLDIGTGWGHTWNEGIKSITLVFEEDYMSWYYTKGGYSEGKGFWETEYKNDERYNYTITENRIKIDRICEWEYGLKGDKLTMTLVAGKPFPVIPYWEESPRTTAEYTRVTD